MDNFLLKVNFSSTSDVDKSFDLARNAFSHDRNILKYQHQEFELFIDRIHNQFSIYNDGTIFDIAFGRDFSKSLLQTNKFKNYDTDVKFSSFQVEIDKQKRKIRMKTDPLGLFTVFYILKDDTLIVSNYFPSIAAIFHGNLEVEPDSYHDALFLGMTAPGKTLFKNIYMVPPLEELHFIDKQLIQTAKMNKFSQLCLANSAREIYSLFQDSVKTILKTSDIWSFNLTGGCDTRLNFSTLDPNDRSQYTYIFDELNGNKTHLPYDRKIVQLLKEKFHLDIHYRHPRHFHANHISLEKCDSIDNLNHLMTGMYGGESLGGRAINCLPDHLNGEDNLDYQAALSRYEQNKTKFRNYLNTDSDLGFAFYLFHSSFFSFIYEEKNWAHPCVLSQRKISSFTNIPFLMSLFKLPFERIKNYRLYQEIYSLLPKEFIEVPFFSPITEYNYKNFVGLHKEEPIKDSVYFDELMDIPSFSIQFPNQENLSPNTRRHELLVQWLHQ